MVVFSGHKLSKCVKLRYCQNENCYFSRFLRLPCSSGRWYGVRFTRNCCWNKCGFCPAYKFGLRYSKRSIDEVKEDIRRAKLMP